MYLYNAASLCTCTCNYTQTWQHDHLMVVGKGSPRNTWWAAWVRSFDDCPAPLWYQVKRCTLYLPPCATRHTDKHQWILGALQVSCPQGRVNGQWLSSNYRLGCLEQRQAVDIHALYMYVHLPATCCLLGNQFSNSQPRPQATPTHPDLYRATLKNGYIGPGDKASKLTYK